MIFFIPKTNYNIFFLFLFSLLLIYTNESPVKMKPIFKCGSDKTEPIPKLATEILPIKNPKRVLDNVDQDGFKEFNIFLDLNNFDYEVELYNLSSTREIFVSGMTKALNTIKSLLKVKPTENYQFQDEDLRNESINKWNTTIVGSKASQGMSELGIDLFIFVRFGDAREMGELSLASASARYLDVKTGQPTLGIININRDVDYSKQNAFQFFEMIVLHEFTHVLGFSSYFFVNYFNNILIKVDEYGITRAYINSTKVVEVAKKYYNCDSLIGVELEEFGGEQTLRSHWEARILLGEYMNGVAYNEEVVISEFTLALLEDSGYYKAKYYTGGLMQYGKNKGCDFLDKKCVNNGEVNPKFKNEFFDTIYYLNYDPSCSSGRQSRTYHGIYLYDSIPVQYQYYSNSSFGGRSSCDYCPVSQEYYYEANNIYYVGHCSEKGSGEYGSKIPYKDKSKNRYNYYTSGDLTSITGEFHSNNSFCVLSSLISQNIQGYSDYSSTVRAICYKMFCSERSLTIQINDNYIVCPRAGGKINAMNFDGYLLCPDYYLICSGTVLCNDMFDCVDKKSLLKDDIIYDYEIKTSQDISDAEIEAVSQDAYELSDNGECPQFCSQCNEKHECIKCKNGYGIYELKKGDISERNCKNINELSNYYLKEGIYYKCLDNCIECANGEECITCHSDYVNINQKCFLKIENCKRYNDEGKCERCVIGYKIYGSGSGCEIGIENCDVFNNSTCITCENNYILSDNLCYKKIDNCIQYGNEEYCQKCNESYAFKDNDRLNCYDINQFTEYFTKDDGISYFKCDDTSNDGIDNCKICEYNYFNLICKQCKSDFVLKDDETNKCYSKELFVNDTKYFYENEYLIKSCSHVIANCTSCTKNVLPICNKCEDNFRLSILCYKIVENCDEYDPYEGDKCQRCKEGYAFEEDERKLCKNINTFEEYYTNDFGISYYKCNDTSRGGISNCRKCKYDIIDGLKCNECFNDYIIKDNENDICYSKELFINDKTYYYDDEFHIKNCSKTINNCDECAKEKEIVNCKKCKDDYFIVNDFNRICNKEDELISNDEYYFNQEINEYFSCEYYHTIENCKKCHNSTICNNCKQGYTFIDDDKLICKNIGELGYKYIMDENDDTIYRKCSDYMENCEYCWSKNECLSCYENYGLYNDYFTCINISKHYHYQNRTDSLFYLCNTTMDNCEKCASDNECIQCIDNYIKINNDESTCVPITDINFNEYYLSPNDTNMYLKCSSLIKNCVTCSYEDGCKICYNGFILLNDDKRNCQDKSKTSLEYHFTEDNHTYYSCNDYKFKSNIHCFSLLPKQNINLTFIQTQLINHKLACYFLTHSPLPKNFSLIFEISIFSSTLRNLENSNKKIILKNEDDDSSGESNTIIKFSSQEKYDDSVSYIEINDIQLDKGNSITKAVADNNICNIKFNKYSNLANTGKVKDLIEKKKIPDFSSIKEEKIETLTIDKLQNCEFNLKSEDSTIFSEDKFELNFVESNNTDNEIKAECDIKDENTQMIECKINEEVNNNYFLKDEILSLSNKLVIISTNNEEFKFNCTKKFDLKKIIIIAGAAVGVLIIICICCCCCCKKKKEPDNPNMNILPTNHQPYDPNEIYMYDKKNNSKSFRNGINSGIRLY